MMTKMTKKSTRILICTVAVSVLALAGFFTYMKWKNIHNNSAQQSNLDTCKTINREQICTEAFVGLRESDAIKKAYDARLTPNMRMRDGNTSIANDSLGGIQIYFIVEKGIVVKAEFN